MLEDTEHRSREERIAAVERIGLEIARANAADVDARARFPTETITALRRSRALSAAIPEELGGAGATLVELVRSCAALGQHCASSAMVLAMHHIQIFCIARHSKSAELTEYLRAVVSEQRLIASVTSEVGPSGDLRKSVASVSLDASGAHFELVKRATTLSYGAHADDLLITARRSPSSAPNDQVLVLARRGEHTLSDLGSWDTMGMRGTCSPGATVRMKGEAWQILPEPFGEIATYTMTPISHILWAACWLGIATDAVANARAIVRAEARGEPGAMPRSARRLSEVVAELQLMQNEVHAVAADYDRLLAADDRAQLASLAFALRINNLKLSASRLVVQIVGDALGICGIQGYKNDSPHSLSRHLRDACSAALMINNDRIHETNASLLLVYKGT